MNNTSIVIEQLSWERVQFFVEGRIENGQFNHPKFVLRNLTETKVLEANEVTLHGNQFKCRFNIAILDDGNYLPEDQYLLVMYQEHEVVAKISPKYLEINNYQLSKEEWKEYEALSTKNDKYNYMLSFYKKVFHKGGSSNNIYYEIKPAISREVNEFVFNVEFKHSNTKLTGIKKLVSNIRLAYRKISFNVRNTSFKAIFKLGKFLHVRKGNQVLFTSDSRSNMSGNFKFIYDEMLRQKLDKKYKIHQIFKRHITDRRNIIDKFKFPFLLGKADYILIDDYHPLIYTVDFKKTQELIQVWHAVGAFKTVGFSRTGKQGGPFFDSVAHRNYTKAIVSSDHDIPFYGEAFGIKEEYILPTGIPRTDIFFDDDYKNKVINKMQNELPIKNKTVILFAPTFRGNGHHTAHYPFFKIDFERLANYCEENNSVVLFKMHPFVKNKLNIPKAYQKYLIDISYIREVNDVLFITDILISDYSSLIYEYATFKKPMLFYAFDLEDYIATRDFYEQYESFVPGKIVKTFDDLLSALENNDFEQEKVEPFLNKHFKYTDGQSSKRVVERIFK